jgi:hypothetical protein
LLGGRSLEVEEGLHLDHHVAVDLVLCEWVAKADFHQVFATFDKLLLGFHNCYFLHIFATVIGVLDKQMSFQLFDYYNHGPSTEKKA